MSRWGPPCRWASVNWTSYSSRCLVKWVLQEEGVWSCIIHRRRFWVGSRCTDWNLQWVLDIRTGFLQVLWWGFGGFAAEIKGCDVSLGISQKQLILGLVLCFFSASEWHNSNLGHYYYSKIAQYLNDGPKKTQNFHFSKRKHQKLGKSS